jgi:hypothetical protein
VPAKESNRDSADDRSRPQGSAPAVTHWLPARGRRSAVPG